MLPFMSESSPATLPVTTALGAARHDHRAVSRPRTTRAVMRAWIDPAGQSRHYVPEPGA